MAPGGAGEPRIGRGDEATIFRLLDQGDARPVFGGEGPQPGPDPGIGGGVVDDDKMRWQIRMGKRPGQAVLHQREGVVDRHDDRDLGPGGALRLMRGICARGGRPRIPGWHGRTALHAPRPGTVCPMRARGATAYDPIPGCAIGHGGVRRARRPRGAPRGKDPGGDRGRAGHIILGVEHVREQMRGLKIPAAEIAPDRPRMGQTDARQPPEPGRERPGPDEGPGQAQMADLPPVPDALAPGKIRAQDRAVEHHRLEGDGMGRGLRRAAERADGQGFGEAAQAHRLHGQGACHMQPSVIEPHPLEPPRGPEPRAAHNPHPPLEKPGEQQPRFGQS